MTNLELVREYMIAARDVEEATRYLARADCKLALATRRLCSVLGFLQNGRPVAVSDGVGGFYIVEPYGNDDVSIAHTSDIEPPVRVSDPPA